MSWNSMFTFLCAGNFLNHRNLPTGWFLGVPRSWMHCEQCGCFTICFKVDRDWVDQDWVSCKWWVEDLRWLCICSMVFPHWSLTLLLRRVLANGLSGNCACVGRQWWNERQGSLWTNSYSVFRAWTWTSIVSQATLTWKIEVDPSLWKY